MALNVKNVSAGTLTDKTPNAEITQKKQTFSTFVNSEKVMGMLANTLKNPVVRDNFVANIISVYSNSPSLASAKPLSIVSAGLMAQNLGLSLSPTLAYAYILPFDVSKKDPATGEWYKEKVAQFSLSWRGYYQLAIRSGQFKVLNALEVKEGELKKWNPFTEEIQIDFIEDEDQRDAAETIGYYAYFETVSGFKKGLYWSKKKIINHAATYVPSLVGKTKEEKKKNLTDYLNGKVNGEAWQYSSFYYKSFDQMAIKTMYRQIFKFCPMSVEMQNAYNYDERIGNPDDISTGLMDNAYPFEGEPIGTESDIAPTVNVETGEIKG